MINVVNVKADLYEVTIAVFLLVIVHNLIQVIIQVIKFNNNNINISKFLACDSNESLQPSTSCIEKLCDIGAQNAPIISNDKCCPCKTGFKRSSPSGNCIPDENQCPTCGTNSQSQPTGSCDDTACNGSSIAGPDLTEAKCCKCNSGFSRHEGNCIPDSQCQPDPGNSINFFENFKIKFIQNILSVR